MNSFNQCTVPWLCKCDKALLSNLDAQCNFVPGLVPFNCHMWMCLKWHFILICTYNCLINLYICLFPYSFIWITFKKRFIQSDFRFLGHSLKTYTFDKQDNSSYFLYVIDILKGHFQHSFLSKFLDSIYGCIRCKRYDEWLAAGEARTHTASQVKRD